MRVRVHDIVTALVQVLDEAEVQGTTTILVALELGDGCLGRLGRVEADNTSAAGTATGLILDFGLLHLADGGEELNQIVVAGRPG